MTEPEPETPLVERVRDEQRRRWDAGTPVPAEELLARHPALRADPAAALEVIYQEVVLRASAGQEPRPAEYVAQFPDLADQLGPLFELHQVLEEPGGVGQTLRESASSILPPVPRLGPPGYELGDPLGVGGMGEVYLARDAALGRDVAVKVLRDTFAAGGPASRRFAAEARVTAQLQHPGIPPVHEVGELPDGRPFLVMKLIRGRTLAQLIADGPSPSHDRGRLVAAFEAVCQAVAFAHAQAVIHRDIKPANVMVGAFGEVQVMDWGLAKVLGEPDAGSPLGDDPKQDHTHAGTVLGTPAYMPPEQARGEVGAVDRRSDVFGLGAVLGAILTGKPPYADEDDGSVTERARQGDLARAFARLDDCGADAELISLCKRCLSPRPDDRPADAGEVAALVAAYRAGVEERLRRAEREQAVSAAEAAEQRKRRRVQLALTAAVGLLATAGGAFAWWQARVEGDRKAERATFDTELQVKAAQARGRATELLALATELRPQYRYAEAANALRQAGELAVGDPDLGRAVERASADLEFVRALDAIRAKRLTWISEGGGKGRFDEEGVPEAYRKAFAARGLDPTADPAAVGDRVAVSAVRAELVCALDDWAVMERDPAVRDRVLAAVRRADPDPAVSPFRDPAVWGNPARLRQLLAGADADRLSPGAVVAVAELMRKRGVVAAPLLRRAMARHPRDFYLAFTLGQVLADTDPEQVGAYRAARAIRSDHFALQINLGHALDTQGDLDGAVAAWQEAVRLDPASAMARANLGPALAKKKDMGGAMTEVRRAIGLDPKDARAHNQLGHVLLMNNDPAAAVAAHREAIRLAPREPLYHYNLGVALRRSGNLDEAITEYQEAIRLDPTYAIAHFNLGNALMDKRELGAAVTAYKEATRHDPRFASAHNNLGRALHRLKDYDGALAAYGSAVRINPTNASYRNNLGLALRLKGYVDAAVVEYREAIRLDPAYAEAHNNLGAILCDDRRDYDGAVACFREAIRLDPGHLAARTNLGNALIGRGDVDGAVAAYREVIRRDPTYAPARSRLGATYLEHGRYPEAIAAARAAIAVEPRWAFAHATLGDALLRTGDLAGARAALTVAARLDQRFKSRLDALPVRPVAPPPRPAGDR
jgi:tetratricopeptide (TPR) repeat protein